MTRLLLSLLLSATPQGSRDVVATNAFFYYADLEGAWRFYTETLGLETVADYGFAKILQVSGTSYLILVDAAKGMHRADEPKTVALALVTDELEGWFEYLKASGAPMRTELRVEKGGPHDGFVVVDPEGYFLELERFNPHPENENLLPILERAPSVHAPEGQETKRPKALGIKATILWMYYKDVAAIETFYGGVMGFERVADQGWAKIYRSSPTGFIGPVDESKGMHRFTKEKGVTVSFFVSDVDSWFTYLKGQESFVLRTPQILDESGKVRVFVGYDRENYFVELDTFLDVEGNEKLLERLRARAR
jgi:catechol 2,3-dioxygenase-like lactoylglutathione lyase family enzyme